MFSILVKSSRNRPVLRREEVGVPLHWQSGGVDPVPLLHCAVWPLGQLHAQVWSPLVLEAEQVESAKAFIWKMLTATTNSIDTDRLPICSLPARMRGCELFNADLCILGL